MNNTGLYHFPLYYQRLLTSTVGWTDEEFGCYMRLLIHQFDNGSIPNNMELLKKISPKISENWKLLSKKFIKNSKGELENSVMRTIRKDSLKKLKANRVNGCKGGRPRNPTVSEEKPHGYNTEPYGNPKKTQRVRQSIINNQYLIDQSKDVVNNSKNLTDDSILMMIRNVSRNLTNQEEEKIISSVQTANEKQKIGNPQAYISKVVETLLDKKSKLKNGHKSENELTGKPIDEVLKQFTQ